MCSKLRFLPGGRICLQIFCAGKESIVNLDLALGVEAVPSEDPSPPPFSSLRFALVLLPTKKISFLLES